MAFMSQEKKQEIATNVKPILKRYGIKGSLSVHHHNTLVLTIKSGRLDFIANFNGVAKDSWAPVRGLVLTDHLSVNHYHFRDHFDGECREFLSEIIEAMMEGNHDRSDIQTDYFDVGWYISINIGRWNKPYVLEM